MFNIIMIIVTLILFCLGFPFFVCYMDKKRNPITMYLDWVYNIVNKKKGD